MQTLEIRRHSLRKTGGGSQLSQAGVDAARALGATIGPFACVVTSVVPRARETAIAMGFAVDYELVMQIEDPEVYRDLEGTLWWQKPQPFVALADLIARRGALRRYAQALAAAWRDILTAMPDNNAALLIGHSGELEIGLAACFPQADYASWGLPFAPLEGARLGFSGEPAHFSTLEFVRGNPAARGPG